MHKSLIYYKKIEVIETLEKAVKFIEFIKKEIGEQAKQEADYKIIKRNLSMIKRNLMALQTIKSKIVPKDLCFFANDLKDYLARILLEQEQAVGNIIPYLKLKRGCHRYMGLFTNTVQKIIRIIEQTEQLQSEKEIIRKKVKIYTGENRQSKQYALFLVEIDFREVAFRAFANTFKKEHQLKYGKKEIIEKTWEIVVQILQEIIHSNPFIVENNKEKIHLKIHISPYSKVDGLVHWDQTNIDHKYISMSIPGIYAVYYLSKKISEKEKFYKIHNVILHELFHHLSSVREERFQTDLRPLLQKYMDDIREEGLAVFLSHINSTQSVENKTQYISTNLIKGNEEKIRNAINETLRFVMYLVRAKDSSEYHKIENMGIDSSGVYYLGLHIALVVILFKLKKTLSLDQEKVIFNPKELNKINFLIVRLKRMSLKKYFKLYFNGYKKLGISPFLPKELFKGESSELEFIKLVRSLGFD